MKHEVYTLDGSGDEWFATQLEKALDEGWELRSSGYTFMGEGDPTLCPRWWAILTKKVQQGI